MTLIQWIGVLLLTCSLLVIAGAFLRGCTLNVLEADEDARTELARAHQEPWE